MGRRKSRVGGLEAENGDHRGSLSTSSICGRSSATEDLAEFYSDDEEDKFGVAIEMLYEKRATTRESGLQRLVRLLTLQWQFEECTFKQETLSRLFLGCFKRGGPIEAALAARGLGLHVITLGVSSATEEIFSDALSAMEPVILKGFAGKGGSEVKVAAIEALSIMCFVAGTGPEETLGTMHILRKAFTKGTPDAQAAALKGWALLFTTVPAWKLGGTEFVEDQLKMLALLLHSDNVDVRAAAGEAVAVIYDTCDLSTLPESGPVEREEGSEEEEEQQRSGVTVERLEDIVARMQDLAKNRGDETRRSKKERVVLRSTFRELASILEGGDIPEQKVKLRHGDVLVVDTLAGNIQLNAFRSYLNEGFQPHLLANTLLHQVFNFRPRQEAPGRLSAIEKRLYRSPASGASKERSKERSHQRKMSAAYRSSTV